MAWMHNSRIHVLILCRAVAAIQCIDEKQTRYSALADVLSYHSCTCTVFVQDFFGSAITAQCAIVRLLHVHLHVQMNATASKYDFNREHDSVCTMW